MKNALFATVALATAAAAWGCGSAPMDEESSDPNGAPSETRAAGEEENAATTEEALTNEAQQDVTKNNEGDEQLGQSKSGLWGGWGGFGGWRGGFGWGGFGGWGGGWRGGFGWAPGWGGGGWWGRW